MLTTVTRKPQATAQQSPSEATPPAPTPFKAAAHAKIKTGLRVAACVGVGVGLLLGAAAAAMALVFGVGTAHVENIGQYVQEFFKSSGFGGLAALCAAIIAFIGIRRQITSQQQTGQANRWWATFQWTADRALPSGPDDVPLPKSVAVATLEELAVTATDDAQKIACSGLVDLLGDEPEDTSTVEAPETVSPDQSLEDVRRKGRQAVESLLRSKNLDVALTSYAQATQGSKAESPIARRRSYEAQVRNAVTEAAAQLGLDYESAALLGIFGDPDLENRYNADGVIQRRGGSETLVEVAGFERTEPRIVQRLKQIANNDNYPVIFVAPVPLPDFMRDALRSPDHWIQWNVGDDLSTLRDALQKIV